MSWFDTAGFANLAKSALKEAQKKIDKALVVDEEDNATKSGSSQETEGYGENFFSSWGIGESGKGKMRKSESLGGSPVSAPTTSGDAKASGSKISTSTSLWGSFTGSFFDNPNADPAEKQTEVKNKEKGLPVVSGQPRSSGSAVRSMSLDLTGVGNTRESGTEKSQLTEEEGNLNLSGSQASAAVTSTGVSQVEEDSGAVIREEIRSFPPVEVVFRRRDQSRVGANSNRLSVISSEGSDRRSTDSCDLVGSDSDPASTPQSAGNSVDIVTSHSSVDIIQSSPTSPSKYSSDSISPISDSVEVCPVKGEACTDEEEEEVSESFTASGSESTTVTAMVQHSSFVHSSIDQRPPSSASMPSVMLTSTSSADIAPDSDTTLSPGTIQSSSSRLSIDATSPLQGSRYEDGSTSPSQLHAATSDLSRISSSAGSEATLVESGSYDDATLEESDSMEKGSLGSSKETMLADAMVDSTAVQQQRQQQTSPAGSDRSDLIKVGSSGHTSGDEIETTTSSDIEIISSANTNGDSSSTTSRQSPSKIVQKPVSLSHVITGRSKGDSWSVVSFPGHRREPSEASSGGSEEGSDVERLLKRISEMTEVLEARESKLIDLSRLNAALQESNSELKSQLERQRDSDEVKAMSEEFTQRLASLEKKFHQSLRDKEQLKKQLDIAKMKASEKEEDMEKDQLIHELRTEGEKLSKQILGLNNIIKKLKAAEKDNTKVITNLKDQVACLSQELERIKKSISAKEEMEQSHIGAVNSLTKQKNQLEKEAGQLRNDLTNLTSSLVTSQREFTELSEKYKALELKKAVERAEVEERVRAEVASELDAADRQVTTLQSALEDLQAQLTDQSHQHSKSIAALRRELNEVSSRLEAAEKRGEESVVAVSDATEPLLRQIRELSMTSDSIQAESASVQATLRKRISELENLLESTLNRERSVRSEYEAMSSREAELKLAYDALRKELDSVKEQLARTEWMKARAAEDHALKDTEYNECIKKLTSEAEDLKKELQASQEVLGVTKAALEAEKRKTMSIHTVASARSGTHSLLGSRTDEDDFDMTLLSSPLQQQQAMSQRTPSGGGDGSLGSETAPSPTLSQGRVSLSESVYSTHWPPTNLADDLFESMTSSGRMYDSVLRPSNNTSLIEAFQSQLKLKEGELEQLQWEVSRLENERSSLSSQVVELSGMVEVLKERQSSLSDLQTSYDALLTMYGEKMEENQELKMDLTDVKEMYKAQIEELLKKDDSTSPPLVKDASKPS